MTLIDKDMIITDLQKQQAEFDDNPCASLNCCKSIADGIIAWLNSYPTYNIKGETKDGKNTY